MRDVYYEIVVDPIAEARRYVENAKELLKNHGQLDYENRFYGDRKYVRMAGNTLWNGMLLVLKATFQIKKNKGRLRSCFDFFRAYLRGIFEDDFSVERTTIAGYRSERNKKSDQKDPQRSRKRKKNFKQKIKTAS
jgi:hypothetical protein